MASTFMPWGFCLTMVQGEGLNLFLGDGC